MWCANCEADVAAEVSPVDGRVQCAVCSTELARARGIGEKTRNAREILERWSKTDLSDPFGPLPAIRKPERIMDSRPENDLPDDSKDVRDTAPKNAVPKQPDEPQQPAEPEQPAVENIAPRESRRKIRRTHVGRPSRRQAAKSDPMESAVEAGAEEFEQLTASRPVKPRSKPKFRIDAAVPPGGVGGAASSSRARTRRPARDLRYDEPHGRAVPPPHYEYTLREPEQKENWSVAAGQWLAYIGVLALTIGTAIVVYGHFGGYSNYTPTGWLITTVGQMLLFLGVINLVSGGMEQSNDEVSQRIEMLGEHILRIEQATDHALRGPKIPAAVYDGEEAESERANQESYLSE